MQTILLIMKRKAIVQGLMRRLQGDHSLQLIFESDYTQAVSAVRAHSTYALLLEVAESGGCNTLYCLDICAALRRELPNCKLLLMCPERNKTSIEKAVQAKREGGVDDFIFCDTSIDYLASKLLSL